MKVILATRNQGKVKEFASAFAELGWSLESLPDHVPAVLEDGVTFEQNAIKKAEEVSRFLDATVLADDSGMEVDALNGEPGVYSARYAGEGASDEQNNKKLLEMLEGVPTHQRSARFVCVLALAAPGQETLTVRGECKGIVLEQPRGKNGFGYDPLFLVPEFNKTFAELSLEEKGRISHRSMAIRELVSRIKEEKQ